jgi:hypothetical protein
MLLPPKPDPDTGLPLPPRAPTQVAHVEPARNVEALPAAPAGEGPIVEYFCKSAGWSWLGIISTMAIFTVMSVWLAGGVAAFANPFFWLVFVGLAVFCIHAAHQEFAMAGVEWLQVKEDWVRTYELAQIRFVARGMGGSWIELKDHAGRSLSAPLPLIQFNHRLWAYVYLGMQYSVANGATLNYTARLQFPELVPESN